MIDSKLKCQGMERKARRARGRGVLATQDLGDDYGRRRRPLLNYLLQSMDSATAAAAFLEGAEWQELRPVFELNRAEIEALFPGVTTFEEWLSRTKGSLLDFSVYFSAASGISFVDILEHTKLRFIGALTDPEVAADERVQSFLDNFSAFLEERDDLAITIQSERGVSPQEAGREALRILVERDRRSTPVYEDPRFLEQVRSRVPGWQP